MGCQKEKNSICCPPEASKVPFSCLHSRFQGFKISKYLKKSGGQKSVELEEEKEIPYRIIRLKTMNLLLFQLTLGNLYIVPLFPRRKLPRKLIGVEKFCSYN
jgi:hypothetical protein